jgi:ABC-type lipoprotein release transport system permease subunit
MSPASGRPVATESNGGVDGRGDCLFLVSDWLAALLSQVEPFHISTLALVAVSLGAITLVASYLAARRTMRIDPVSALRAN